MNTIFIIEDILDYLKFHIDIRDYDKLKMVSSKYKKYFDLRPLIQSRKYSNIMTIKGCSIRILINIIAKNIINIYNYEDNADINNKIIKNEKEFSLLTKNKGHYLLHSLIEVYYSCYNNDYNQIIKTLQVFEKVCNKIINLRNFTYFITPIMCYIDDIYEETIQIQNFDDAENNNFLNILITINLNLFLSIIIRRLKIIIPDNAFQSIDLLLSNIQNEKLDEIVYNYINYDADGRCFPDYFIKYINEFANTLYIL